MTNIKFYIILSSARCIPGGHKMKEVRIEDLEDGGILIAFRCCPDSQFCQDHRIFTGPFRFIPTNIESSGRIHCMHCKRCCEVSYTEGFYDLQLPGLSIIYNPGKQICISGCCHCQNNWLKDDYTGKLLETHYVDSHQEGEYTFSCPCKKTQILVREGHFHICLNGNEATLSSEQGKKE